MRLSVIFLYAIAPENHRAAAAQGSQAASPIRREEGLDETVGSGGQFRAVAVPPAFRDLRQALHIDIFYVRHLQKAQTRVGASPAAGAAAAVRGLGDAVIARHVVD